MLGNGQYGWNAYSSIILNRGRKVSAKLFIDARYTGDLIAAAGVSYTVGRESRSKYGESLAGSQVMYGKRKIWEVDPRDENGNLLPFVNTDDPGPEEEGDHKINNYNFRVNLTNDLDNMVPIPKPENYDPKQIELLRRYFSCSLF